MGAPEGVSGEEADDPDNDKFHTGNFKDTGVWKKSADSLYIFLFTQRSMGTNMVVSV